MNIALVRWLIANREVLMKCIGIIQEFDASAPLIERWDVADRLARVIIPALESEDIDTLAFGDPYILSDDNYAAMSCGAELAAMGVDWQATLSILIPILTAILKALLPTEEE